MARPTLVRGMLTAAATAATMLSLFGGPAVAATGGQGIAHAVPATMAASSPHKPAPTVPSNASDPAAGPRIIAKPNAAAPSASPQTAPHVSPNGALGAAPQALIMPLQPWTVSLTASPTVLWPTQYSSLTAIASGDVGPTPYYLSIYDVQAGSYLVTCGIGATCSTSVTKNQATNDTFYAFVSTYPAAFWPADVQAWATASVTWRSVSVSLAADPTTVGVGSSATLTAVTSADVGPTPFWIEIFDATAGTRIAACGGGTACTTTVSQSSATTHAFIAYVSHYDTAFPPSDIQATSGTSYVTWSDSGWALALSGPATGSGTVTATATANSDVAPTQYWIEIFNENGTRIAVCGSGTTCSANFTPTAQGDYFVAFVSSYDSTLPPANAQASSNAVYTRQG